MLILLMTLTWGAAQAQQTIRTNSLTIVNAPPWVTERRADKVTDAVEQLLEWQIRRVFVQFYRDTASFARENKLGSNAVVAFTRREDLTVHLGPAVTQGEWEGVLAHELTHVILRQKYKQSVPDWLEEGLANYIAQKVGKQIGTRGRGVVDYKWLAAQPADVVTGLGHPIGDGKDKSEARIRYRYAASTAMMEMIASKCDVFDLLQLSVGKKLETYLINTCGISDVNKALADWVMRRAQR